MWPQREHPKDNQRSRENRQTRRECCRSLSTKPLSCSRLLYLSYEYNIQTHEQKLKVRSDMFAMGCFFIYCICSWYIPMGLLVTITGNGFILLLRNRQRTMLDIFRSFMMKWRWQFKHVVALLCAPIGPLPVTSGLYNSSDPQGLSNHPLPTLSLTYCRAKKGWMWYNRYNHL